MIDNQKINELLNYKIEYLYLRTKQQIKNDINRDDKNNIINLKLKLKKYDFFCKPPLN